MEKAEKWVMCEGEYFYYMDQFDQDQKYIPSSMCDILPPLGEVGVSRF